MAFLLSALIGLEREMRHKSAGSRTHTLVVAKLSAKLGEIAGVVAINVGEENIATD